MCLPRGIAISMTAISNLSCFFIQQIFHSPFVDFFAFGKILSLRLIIRPFAGRFFSIFRHVIVEGQCCHHCRKVNTCHLSITEFIRFRIPNRLPLPEHTSVFFVIRTGITHLFRTIPHTFETGFREFQIFIHSKKFVATCQADSPPHDVIVDEPAGIFIVIIKIKLTILRFVPCEYFLAECFIITCLLSVFLCLCQFIGIHCHIPINRLTPDSRCSIATVNSTRIGRICLVNIFIGV